MLLYVCSKCGLRYQAAGPEHVRRCICGGELKHG